MILSIVFGSIRSMTNSFQIIQGLSRERERETWDLKDETILYNQN